MKQIDSEEKVGQPGLQMGPPPDEGICIMLMDLNKKLGKKMFFHLDHKGGDPDGKVRARVGEALSKALEGKE